MAKETLAFKTRFNKPDTIASETGTHYDKVRNIIIDENGHKALVITGETDRYAKIQAHKEECLIENILVQATMDPSILEKHKGTYFDATTMPRTLAEFQNLSLKLTQEFASLPANIKAKFDNSAEKYVMQYGSEEWGKALGLVKEKLEEKKEEPKEEIKEEK